MARTKSQFRIRDRQRVRRLLTNMGPEVEKQVVSAYQRHAPSILAYSRGETPSRSGRLRAALAFKIFPKTLRLRVGLLTKAVQKKFFYARILEYGRRAQSVRVNRRRPVSGGTTQYIMRVKGIAPSRNDFVRGRAWQFVNRTLGNELRGILSKTLKRLAAGG